MKLAKWLHYGFPEEVYTAYPDFARFLLETPLGSQMKLFAPSFLLVDGDVALLVEGEWIPFKKFITIYEARRSERYKETFIVEKESGAVYTYLGNGLGLQKHHPYESLDDTPFYQMEEGGYERTLELAKEFGREGDHIVQIITSYEGDPEKNSNFQNTIFGSQHAYMRLIDNEGRVTSVGFGFDKPIILPLKNDRGRMRRPDIYEYKLGLKRYVTNIALTRHEARRLKAFIRHYQMCSPTFNLAYQNCTVFIREGLRYAAKIDITTESPIADVAHSVAPTWIQRIVEGCRVLSFGPLEPIVEFFSDTMKFIGSLFLSLISLCLGSGVGTKRGASIRGLSKPEPFAPPAHKVDYWIDIERYGLNLPTTLQSWQKEQASTKLEVAVTKIA